MHNVCLDGDCHGSVLVKSGSHAVRSVSATSVSGSGLNLGGLVSIILTFTLLASIWIVLFMHEIVLLKVLHGLDFISSIATTFSLVEAVNNHLL